VKYVQCEELYRLHPVVYIIFGFYLYYNRQHNTTSGMEIFSMEIVNVNVHFTYKLHDTIAGNDAYQNTQCLLKIAQLLA
jgi:hypothetical protein